MLVLTRKKGQVIQIGKDIEIHIVSIEGDQIKIGISAPKDVVVLRKELIEEVRKSNQEAVTNHINLDQLKNAKKN